MIGLRGVVAAVALAAQAGRALSDMRRYEELGSIASRLSRETASRVDVALGILPGGTTNVMARSLGMPTDPVEATSYLAHRLRSGTRRRINVGRADKRYFLFSVGMGLDGEVVKRFSPLVQPGMKPPNAISRVAGTREFSSPARNSSSYP